MPESGSHVVNRCRFLADGASARHGAPAARGFTLVELIVIMIVIGILAVTVIPRFVARNAFDVHGFNDGTLALLRYGQKAAVAQRRAVCVDFSAVAVTLTIATAFGGTCNMNLTGPDGSSPYTLAVPAGVAFSSLPANFTFLPSGAASLAQTINVSGASTPITVVAATGHVY